VMNDWYQLVERGTFAASPSQQQLGDVWTRPVGRMRAGHR